MSDASHSIMLEVWTCSCDFISHCTLSVQNRVFCMVLTFAFPIPLSLSRLDLAGNDVVSLSANHLQKLRLSFQLTTPYGQAFKPQQVVFCLSIDNASWSCIEWTFFFFFNTQFTKYFVVWQAFLKLRHETKVEHIFVVGSTGRKFGLTLVKYLLLVIT